VSIPQIGPGSGLSFNRQEPVEIARRVLAPYLALTESQLRSAFGPMNAAERAHIRAFADQLIRLGTAAEISQAQLIKRSASG
jgi:hypothetical protein